MHKMQKIILWSMKGFHFKVLGQKTHKILAHAPIYPAIPIYILGRSQAPVVSLIFWCIGSHWRL
jgi:hypothetical protein